MEEERKIENEKEMRCCCQALLAVMTKEGIEIKCRRCHRVVLIPYEETQKAISK